LNNNGSSSLSFHKTPTIVKDKFTRMLSTSAAPKWTSYRMLYDDKYYESA